MTVRLVFLQVQPSPSLGAWRGFDKGRLSFVIVALSAVFATGGVEATSLALMARVTCLMSSLTGMFEQNLIPLLCHRVGKAPGGVPLLLDLPSNRFPLNGDSMGSTRGWIELAG